VNLPDGAEQVARQVADRGGRLNKRYAKDLYRKLTEAWEAAKEAQIEPVVVYVPHVRRRTPTVSPAQVNAQRYTSDYERTVEATLAKLREPLDHPGTSSAQEPEITAVDLPAGPACRVHEMLVAHSEFGDQALTEYVDHYVLPEVYSQDMLLLRGFWVKDSVPGMVELADRIAHTLTFEQRVSGEEEPRPVLDEP
jgi:hypothetical protein